MRVASELYHLAQLINIAVCLLQRPRVSYFVWLENAVQRIVDITFPESTLFYFFLVFEVARESSIDGVATGEMALDVQVVLPICSVVSRCS
jgi:hypothetical protein